MATILVTAYAVNPYKGSEDAMGWNFVQQIAQHNRVIAVTRKNNRADIEKYFLQNAAKESWIANVTFSYYDWPKWMLFWKKGPILSLIYYYFWQLGVALSFIKKKSKIDIVHNLNFHNDWTPTFLWLLGKPLVWGPVGHHNKIPREFVLKQFGWKPYLQDRFLWVLKNIFWHLDPMLAIAKRKAAAIYCMSNDAVQKMRLKDKFFIHPSVACEEAEPIQVEKNGFQIISVGRFVELKGFDLTVRSFAKFYHQLNKEEQQKAKLILVGKGPLKAKLKSIIKEENIEAATQIIEWIPRAELSTIYASSSVFLFPSHEGAGMVVPEAMSYELPVVCVNSSGPGQLIHPTSSLRVEYNKYEIVVEELAQKLQQLHSNSSFYEVEKELAKERYQNMFRWQVRGNLLFNIYNEVLIKSNKEIAIA